MRQNALKILIGLIVLGIFGVLYWQKSAIYNQMDRWMLIPRPERFTELYLENHINLPKQISIGEKISFAFTIHNLEGEKKEYSYNVYFKSEDGKVIEIEEKSITIENGEYRTIEELYTSTLEDNKGGVYVELENLQQGIHFLLNSNN